jgi:hypothetical protein
VLEGLAMSFQRRSMRKEENALFARASAARETLSLEVRESVVVVLASSVGLDLWREGREDRVNGRSKQMRGREEGERTVGHPVEFVWFARVPTSHDCTSGRKEKGQNRGRERKGRGKRRERTHVVRVRPHLR